MYMPVRLTCDALEISAKQYIYVNIKPNNSPLRCRSISRYSTLSPMQWPIGPPIARATTDSTTMNNRTMVSSASTGSTDVKPKPRVDRSQFEYQPRETKKSIQLHNSILDQLNILRADEVGIGFEWVPESLQLVTFAQSIAKSEELNMALEIKEIPVNEITDMLDTKFTAYIEDMAKKITAGTLVAG